VGTSGRRRALAATVAAVLAAGGVAATTPAQAASGRTSIAHTKPVWATSARHAATPQAVSDSVAARVYLAGQNPAALAAYATAVSNPASSSYAHYLTAAQAQQRFGTTNAQIVAVSGWLTSAGLKVTATNQHYISVTGSLAQARKAFAVSFGNFKAPDGQVARAPEQDASAPSSVAADVLAISGLDTARHTAQPKDQLPPPPANLYIAGPCSKYYGQKTATTLPAAYGKHQPYALCGYTPRQLRGAYGTAKSGLTGRGATVAIVDAYASPTMKADANQYSRAVGDKPFRSGQYKEVLPAAFDDVTECGAADWYGEESLDVESAHGMAPDANVVYVGAADCTDAGLLGALTTIVDKHLANVVSNSWGETEDQTDTMAAYDQEFQLGATEGIGFNFSSGDCGYEDPANPCGSGRDGSDKIQVDYPTSSPWVTSVGGTSLAVGAKNNYGFETDWGVYKVGLSADGKSWTPAAPGTYPDSYTSGSGGGTSTVYGQPAYQRGVVPGSLSKHLPGGATSATPMRVVPDISALADPQTGFLFGETVQLKDGTYGFALSRIGGTSLASPLVAGMIADADQAFHGSVGFADPLIYRLAGTRAYHDVTGDPLGAGDPVAVARNDYTNTATAQGPIISTLRTTGLDGGGAALLTATRGYDDSTGVGSPDFGFFRAARR
jgi:subtilase family serine protease